MSILLDPFNTAPPELVPPSVLPATAAVKIAVTTNVDTPNSAPETSDGETVQGVELSAEAGDVVLLLGQNDPTENGFWSVDTGGGVPLQSEAQFVRDGAYYRQFKVPVAAGTNAGKTYFLATPTPAPVAAGVRFYELTVTTPHVNNPGNWDTTPPERRRLDEDAPFDATYFCKVALNGNTFLPLNPGPKELDGVALVNGDYYLLKGQEAQSENGVFVVKADGDVKAQPTGLVRAWITGGTNKGKQFSVDQDTGEVTSLAPGVID